MNKLNINTPGSVGLGPFSILPAPVYDRPRPGAASAPGATVVPRYSIASQNRPSLPDASCRRGAAALHSTLLFSSSQSQQSLSQGVSCSQLPLSQSTQPFSQLSQDDPSTAFEEWRCNREAGKRPSSNLQTIPSRSSSQPICREEKTARLTLSTANNLLQKIQGSDRLPEELDKRLQALDEGLSKVIAGLDSVQGDLQEMTKAVQNASLESEEIRQKMILQDRSLSVLVREKQNIRDTISATLMRRSDEIVDLKHLSSELQMIPATLTQHLSMIKTELFLFVRNELQTVRESIKSKHDSDCSTAETLPCVAKSVPEKTSKSFKFPATTKTRAFNSKAVPQSRGPYVQKRSKRPTVLKEAGALQEHQGPGMSASHSAAAKKEPVDIIGMSPVYRPRVGSTRASKGVKGSCGQKRTSNKQRQFQRKGGVCTQVEPPNKHEQSTEKGTKSVHDRNPKMQSLCFNARIFDFVDEEGDDLSHFFSNPSGVESTWDETLDEDEAREIRKKMMKARRKRCRSGMSNDELPQ